jgi:hypothetical protein
MLDFLNFLRQKYSELIGSRVRQGTIMDELAVKPTSLLMADFYNTLVDKQTQDNIDNWNVMTEEQLDYFGNKFFYPRVSGEQATGVVRIWINEPIDVDITTDFRASTADGLLYKAVNPRRISSNSLSVSTDTYGKYFFDIGIIAENSGSQYNQTPNTIQAISGISFTYSYATNPKDLIPGSAHENNQQYSQRLLYSVNDRSLGNKRSLYAGMKGLFPYIYSMYVAGAGDKYMTRDRLQAIDLSNPPKEAKFLGKISGDNVIKHSAYWDIFPGLAGSRPAAFAGPFSIKSEFPYPQTVEAVDPTNDDPAYHGYPLYQEATDEMYRGLYYDDYRNFMDVSTTDLFNITEENISATPIVQPDDTWMIGFNGRPAGDYGSSSQDKTQILFFENADVVFRGGNLNSITACKDINKRIGLKSTGSFTTPAIPTDNVDGNAYGSSIQFVFGGADFKNITGTSIIDSFTGLGFGVMIRKAMNTSVLTEMNAVAFFTHSSSIDSTVIFTTDTTSLATGGLGTLKETGIRLNESTTYFFEYVLYDDLSMSLTIAPRSQNTTAAENDSLLAYPNVLTLDSSVLKFYQNAIMNLNSQEYGSLMKVTLNNKTTDTTNEWRVSNLKVVDLAQHRPTALYMFNVEGLEEPISLMFRGSGIGAVGKAAQAGHSVFVWNLELPGRVSGTTLLSSGGWQTLDSVSDPDGTKDTVSTALFQTLTNIDRYVVTTRFGKVIIFMVACQGQSRASIEAQGDTYNGDINATLTMDYIKLQDIQTDVYRGNNKCDIYVSTLRNVDNFRTLTKQITRSDADAYFTIDAEHDFEMPIVEILTVADTASGSALSDTDYSIIRTNTAYINSTMDSFLISAPNFTDLTITYSVYNNINTIQDFFDGPEYRKAFGNVLIRHKYPTFLDISINYYGNNSPDELSTLIRRYFDDNINTVFDLNAFIAAMYTNKYVNYIQPPVTVNYETFLDNGQVETGSITTSKTIRQIDFFRIRTLNLAQITV